MKPLFNMGVAFIVMSTEETPDISSGWVADVAGELGLHLGPCSD